MPKPIPVVDVSTATLQISPGFHNRRLITLNRAGGIAVTLPKSEGNGQEYEFFVKTTFTTAGTIKVANATDVMVGNAMQLADGGDTAGAYEAGSTADTITLDGSTTGGIKGDLIRIRDYEKGFWLVQMTLSATGSEATPFSATVS